MSDLEKPVDVLIVDDNHELAENLQELLEELPVQTTLALSARQAKRVAPQRLAVAIVDVGLGDGSGLELVGELRGQHEDAEFILMTGQATLETAIQAVRHGAFAYLLKPIAGDDLVAQVERAVSQVHLRRERRTLARALAASEAVYRGVVDNVEAWIVGFDDAMNARLVNERATRGLHPVLPEGLSADSLFGREMATALALATQRPESTRTVEVPFRDRALRWVLTPIPGAISDITVLALGLDVTDQRTAERRIARAETLATIGTLTTGLAHEIRNPLNAASLQLQLLERRMLRTIPDEAERSQMQRPLSLVRDELARLSSLLDDFLGLARPSALDLTTTAVDAIVGHVKSLEGPVCAEHGVELECEVAPNVTVLAERGRIEQVLVNLVANARDALGGPGLVRITASLEPHGMVELRVADNGPGFGDDVERLPEPFYTTKPTGTGLGLAIVQRIVEMHGGSLAFGESDLGGGEVRIRLRSAP